MSLLTKTKPQTSKGSNVQFEAEHHFDSEKMRHYLNGTLSVLHCHHYSTLFAGLACDAVHLRGTELLTEAAAETFHPTLKSYYEQHKIDSITDRIAIAEQYYKYIGLGDVSLEFGKKGGTATMKHSHVDEGWIKKWGRADKRVNYIGEGFIKAAWAAIFNKSNWSEIKVDETQSIVKGASTSRFDLNW